MKPGAKPLTVKTDGEDEAVALAQFSLRPSVKGAFTVQTFSKAFGELDLAGLINELSDQTKLASDGDLKRAESMLMVQAHTLDAIFNKLAVKAASSEYLNQFEANMRLALKAQSQCRATLEALAAIKNPQPLAFVKQANIAHNQQVNNGAAEPTRAKEIENPQNELLEVQHREGLDFGTTAAAGGSNPALEAVGALNGTADDRG